MEIIASGDRMLENTFAETLKCNIIINWQYYYGSSSSKYEVELSLRVGSKEGSECGRWRARDGELSSENS